MIGLDGAYFYLKAIQITLIKFLKKIYFSTNFYNKSLKSKIPVQVYFNPNPFLLSIISPYKKETFKINEINPNEFWLKKKNRNFKKNHNFLWLSLIDRKIDGKNIQKIIYLWILKYSKFKRNIWESSTLSSRIISWILNIDIIIKNGTFEFKKNIFLNIITQCNHLKKNIKYENDYLKKIEILTALILSGLVFKDYEENYKIAIKELEKLTYSFFDSDGFPLSRNPSDLIFFAKYLILCRDSIKDAQQYNPEFLDDIISKNLFCIKFLKTPNTRIPFFNGSTDTNLEQFEKYFENIDLKKKNNKKKVGGIFHFKSRNHEIYFEVGNPPDKKFSKNYQSGPLSFEYYLDGYKIITNCGYGSNISSKAELISKLTASQSTLTINDTTVTKFEKNKLINRVFGNSIKNSFKISELNTIEDKKTIGCSFSHDGYEKRFGCIHKREMYLDKEDNNLKGIDHIFKRSDGIPIRYVFRFYLNPGITAVKTMSGNSALIQISKNKSLLFSIKNESINVEKGIFLGSKKIIDNSCITISGDLVNKNKTFIWEIKKKI